MTTTASVKKSVSRAEETVSAVDAAVGSAFIASGIGSTVLGLMVVLAEASADFANSLKFVAPVGPLSGKTTIAVIAYLVSWVLLHFTIGKNIKLNTAFTITLVLIGLGFLMTFPPFFELFAPAE
jgi:hypothetical protein